jgi:hypothetical protein
VPSPIRVRIPDTVESGIPNSSAISAAVIRNRRNAAIARTRPSALRSGCRRGVDGRSSSPASPSAT